MDGQKGGVNQMYSAECHEKFKMPLVCPSAPGAKHEEDITNPGWLCYHLQLSHSRILRLMDASSRGLEGKLVI